MTERKKTAFVVCPGRGTYNKDDLGYLGRYHGDKTAFIGAIDAYRKARGQITVSELDSAERYSRDRHTRGDNASPLIYACAYADYLSIDRDRYDIVAVTGNSMGWYIALACGQALTPEGALRVINTMGTLMQDSLIGGQLIYPLVDENWQPVPGRRVALTQAMADINALTGHELYVSIELGGMLVFAGNEPALVALESKLKPEQGRFPMRLKNHAAFHTPLQTPISARGKEALAPSLFCGPTVPMIDGRGHIWRPYSTNCERLWDYTLGTQVVETYDFTSAIRVGVREFAPDCLIILGPGSTLGGAVAQSLIAIDWRNLTSKADFMERQKTAPLVLSMGLPDQRDLV
ncbi:MAG: hypothetical protein ACE5DS_06695 [Kiloniellaceae bacterium]